MIELNIHNLNKYYGANQIFHNISFDLKTGERVGLIGQNGCGKTTIFKILMGLEDHQGGEISVRKDARIGYLNQIPEYGEEVNTLMVLQSAFEEQYEIKKQMKKLESSFEQMEGDNLDKAISQYGKLSQNYELSGGYEIETKISKIAIGLQISEEMQDLPFNSLSGGEKTRVILGKILLEEPDILLLDEPSNHLDLTAIEWLESFLKDYKGAVLVISHDRYFLDAVVDKIIELEFDHAEIYQGNYSYYVTEKERRFLIALKEYQNQQKKIERMEAQIERYRIWGDMRDSEKMFKRAKELEKRLEKIDTPKKPIMDKRRIRLDQNMTGRTGKIVLEITELCKSFEEKKLLQNLEFILYYQDSACIIGKNGCGKSTLIKLITGEMEMDRGTIRVGSQVTIGYLPQHVIYEDEEMTVVDYFSRLHNITNGEARSQLAKVLFLKEDVNKKIKFLSGGEKSRLRLSSLTFQGVNFLILDEPTNHLDIDSREVLEEMLMDYPGTILFVSHDRYFINKVADKIINMENAEVKVYEGDYSYYQEEIAKVFLNDADKLSENSKAIGDEKTKYNSYNQKEGKTSKAKDDYVGNKPKTSNETQSKSRNRKTLEVLEIEIEEMEKKKNLLETMMEEYNTDAQKLKEIYVELESIEQELILAYDEWAEGGL